LAEFLTTASISSRLEEILRTARHRVVLISPFLQLSTTLTERLRDCDRRRVEIVVVYGKEELRSDQEMPFADLRHLSLHFLPNLHAKCYCNESLMVIGSMNIYQFSERTNREMGVLLRAAEDAQAFADALEELKSILNAARVARLGKSRAWPAMGSCIRCGSTIRFSPDRPLCLPCYDTWAMFRNRDYPERRCHGCGRDAETSMSRPLCTRCRDESTRSWL
jgi:hypothetical protein